MALTGSDPYFPVGTDVAVLFEPSDATVLEQLLLAHVAMAASADPGGQARVGRGRRPGLSRAAARTAASLSYVARLGMR